MTPLIQSYTNHTRKCVRSISRLTGRYHNTTLDTNLKYYKLYITSQGPRGLEYISSNTQESAEATISEYGHEVDKFALRRLAHKQQRPKRQGLLPGSLLTTPSRRRSPRSSRHRRWHLAPELRHLVASTGKKKKGAKGEQSNREYSSKVLASKDLHYICNIIKGRLYMWTGLQKCQNREKA